jgi:hypothetical protein
VTGGRAPCAGEDAGDVVGVFGDLDEAHASAAALDGAGGDVDGEDAAQEPDPRVAGCSWRGRGERGEVGGGEERELRRRLGLATEDDLGARGRVRGEDAVMAEHVESGRRDEGAEPREEVEGLEQDGAGAVFPRGLEGEADAPVGVELEALLVERRSGDVAAEPLEAFAVAAVHRDLGVDIHPTHLGKGFGRRGDDAHGVDELGGLRAGHRAEELRVPGGRGNLRVFAATRTSGACCDRIWTPTVAAPVIAQTRQSTHHECAFPQGIVSDVLRNVLSDTPRVHA